jgi:hypothetical protein
MGVEDKRAARMPMRENTHVVHLTAGSAAQRGERFRTPLCSGWTDLFRVDARLLDVTAKRWPFGLPLFA